jgi:hypothetical protein
MKSLFLSLVLVLVAALPQSAFAGFGAIAYNSYTGQSGESHGYMFYGDAINAALYACGGNCTIINWEQNSCIALAAGCGRYGEAHGMYSPAAASQTALYECGPGCTLQEWACN